MEPYPFKIEIVKGEGQPPIKGLVHKLVPAGFLMRTDQDHHFKVGDNHVARFLIPNTKYFVMEPIKVVKTYDAIENMHDHSKSFTVEMHFRQIQPVNRELILKFLKLIGQK